MSYDVYLVADLGGPEMVSLGLLDANMTWNLRPMFAAVNDGDGPQEWDGKPASEIADLLTKTLAAFDADPARFEAMNPPNGWGNFEVAKSFTRRVLAACLSAPKAVVRVC